MTHTEFFEATGHEVSEQYFEQKLLPDFTGSGLTADMWLHNYCMNLTFYAKRYTEWLLTQIESLQFKNANLLAKMNDLSAQRNALIEECGKLRLRYDRDEFELKQACYRQAGLKSEGDAYAEELYKRASEDAEYRDFLLREWRAYKQQNKAS